MSEREIKNLARRISKELATVDGPRGPRVTYRPLALKGRKALPRRAMQLYSFLKKKKTATAVDMRRGLRVNRNVIAGALHELRRAQAIAPQPV